MLRLQPILTETFPAHYKRLNQIAGCHCTTNSTLAFDLNAIKNQFCADNHIATMASVNALIYTVNNKILLVEFKRTDAERLPAIRCTYFVQAFNNELPHKVEGSKQLVALICQQNNIVPTPVVMNSVFLVNLNDQDYLTYMANSAQHRGISFSPASPPKSAILNCKWFEEYLKTA